MKFSDIKIIKWLIGLPMKTKIISAVVAGTIAVGSGVGIGIAVNNSNEPEHTHSYTQQTTTEATCTEKGVTTFTCSCNDTYTEEIPVLGHDEESHQAQAPTCTEIGWEEYATCQREGCDYTTYVEISALTHDKVQHQAQAATCTEKGCNAYETCTRCDYSTYVELPALNHDKVQHNAQAATCTEKGWNAYETCSRCDYSTYVEIPALTHDKVQHNAQAATCTEKGWNAYETCTRCDYSTYAELPATGEHTWDNGKITTEPTCTKTGVKTFTCTVCGTATKTEDVPALKHDEKTHEAKAPTCTEIGWNEYVTCEREGCEYSTYKEIPATGNHTWNNGEITTEPTCTEKGVKTFTCTVCGTATKTEDVPALKHDEKTHEAKAPTCTEIGWNEYVTCEREGCEYSTYKEIPATGNHTWNNGEITTEPTCTEKGVKTFTCMVCGTATKTEDVPALKHDEKTHEAQAPTCTEIGWNEYVTCERKGCEYSTYVELPATGNHTWDNGEITTEPTCTETGVKTFTCTVCETATKTEDVPTLEHDYSDEWKYDENKHWNECTCGAKANETPHSGTTAVCGQKSTCTTCGQEYGTIGGHNYATLKYNETTHWYECSCGAKQGETTHNGGNATCTAKAICFTCNQEYGSKANHEYNTLKYNATKHWYECTCGAKQGETTHNGGTATCTAKAVCSTCHQAYGTTLDHEYNTLKYNTTKHWYECTCGAKQGETAHSGGNSTCTTKAVCSTCHQAYGSTLDHEYNTLKYDTSKHWYECTCGAKQGETAHDGGTATCTAKAVCSTCHQFYGEKKPHNYATTNYNASKHWQECSCGAKTGETAHTLSDSFPKTCDGCNYVLTEKAEILFNTLSVNGTTVYGKVSNTTETFSFINEVTAKGGAKFVVSLDITGSSPIRTKTILLNVGDNVVYVTEEINGEPTAVYKVTVRRRPMYEVTFDTNGGTSVQSQTVEEDSLATAPETTRTGYTFVDWNYDFTTPITKDTLVKASWTANKNTPYKVEYYLQNLDDNEYTIYETDDLTGTTDTTATATVKEYTHFTYNASESTISGNVTPDGSLVLSVYYTRDSYAIVVNNNNAKAGTATSINGNYRYEKSFTVTATTNAGYTWLGWYEGEVLACATEEFTFKAEKNVTYTATWKANETTPYTVNYYLQNLDNNEYTLQETVDLTGTTDTTATATLKEYTHFTYNGNKSTISGTINGDGSLVLSVYYTRATYDIVVNGNSAKAGTATSINGNYHYEKEFTLTATTNAGYTWLGWYDGETLVCETLEFTFKAEKNVTYTATWKANETTPYTVNYYLQNLDNNEYTLQETVDLTGTTDTTATATVKEYAHFTYNEDKSIVSGNINGDGSGVLNVYYTRNIYTLSINNSSAGSITNKGTYKYGVEEFTSTVTPYLGYNFLGWYSGGKLLSTDLTFTFTATQNVTAKFEKKAEMSNFYFTSTATTSQITGVNDTTVAEIIVPDYVTSIGNSALSGCSSLTNITIPDSVTSIGEDAFRGCSGLTSITIPDSVTSISGEAFRGCSGLTRVTIGGSVTSIGKYAFEGCNSLMSVYITDIAAWCKISFYDYYANPLYYANNLYLNNKLVTELIIPDSVTSIGGHAFRYCSRLTNITIPDSVTSIGLAAFKGCKNLTSVMIGSGAIGDYAFEDCSSLTSVTIGNGVTSIGYHAFDGCSSLTSVTIPNSVTSIGNYAFRYCSSLTSVVIPDSVTSIGESAFGDCSSLTSVTIPNSVTSIGNYAFRYCSSLTSVVIPDSVTSIGESAFEYCSSLTSVTIPDSVISIGSYAFRGCSSLTIYCETTRKPSGWSSSWNGSSYPVVWGVVTQTYNFESNGGSAVESKETIVLANLPTPTKDEWYFCGWYDNADLTGSPISSPYYSATKTTLYAKWLTEEEYCDGSSFERAIHAEVGGSYTVTIDTAGEKVYYKFTATESKSYTIKSSGGLDTYGYLYDSSQSQVTYNDGSTDFTITRSLTAEKTYYVVVKFYSSSRTGTFTLIIS